MAKSKCCKATVDVMGGKTSGSTNWYECGKCREACDVIGESKRKKREWEAWLTLYKGKLFDVNETYYKYKNKDCKTIHVKITEVGGRRKESR